MKILLIIAYIIFGFCSSAQVSDFKDSLYVELGLTRDQRSKINKINDSYLKDMEGIKDRADTGYNPPKHVQYQHAHCLRRRFRDMKNVTTPEQYEKLRSLRFDIYQHADWLVNFYKKNKLPSIEQAVAVLESKYASDN